MRNERLEVRDRLSGITTSPEEYAACRIRRQRWSRAVLIGLDAAAIFAGALSATWIRFGTLSAKAGLEAADVHLTFVTLGALLVPVWVILLSSEGLYDSDHLNWGSGELTRVARGLALGVVALILMTYALKLPGLSRAWTLLLWVLATQFVIGGRIIQRAIMGAARRRGRWLRPTLIVGSNAEAADVIRILKASKVEGLVPIGCLASSQAEKLSLDWCADDVPCLGTAREIPSVIENYPVDTVIIASSAFDHDVLARIIAELRTLDVDVNVSSGLFEVLTSRVHVREIGGVPVIKVRGLSLSRRNLLIKRAFDLLFAWIGVLAGLPLWLVLILAIKCESKGPVFYRQTRIGKAGRRFAMLKFRSMVEDADERLNELHAVNEASGPLFKMKDDPRITALGRRMRRFSIDEFPQLLNVIKGDMSLVGPRPPLPHEVERYSEHDWRRLEVLPGMTGLWQVSGRSSLTFDEMVRLDLFYIENWSVGLDLALLMRTVPAVFSCRGAY